MHKGRLRRHMSAGLLSCRSKMNLSTHCEADHSVLTHCHVPLPVHTESRQSPAVPIKLQPEGM